MSTGPILCAIQWIDAQGNPTPDTNPAIGTVRLEGHNFTWPNGRTHWVGPSDPYPICEHHRNRMSERGMEHWHFTPFFEVKS